MFCITRSPLFLLKHNATVEISASLLIVVVNKTRLTPSSADAAEWVWLGPEEARLVIYVLHIE